MDNYSQKLLEYIFATQVLILANQLKLVKGAPPDQAVDDMIPEAIDLVKKKSRRIFANMNILE